MQTCSKCNAISPDLINSCVYCSADLREHSKTAMALKTMRANPRVKAIRLTVADDACPHCYLLLKTYPKDEAPSLPHHGCSHANGCRCFYEPVLIETALIGRVVK
ncbi:MAG: hypothetical protein ABIJ39_01540 [Chloroflexota bacterium]